MNIQEKITRFYKGFGFTEQNHGRYALAWRKKDGQVRIAHLFNENGQWLVTVHDEFGRELNRVNAWAYARAMLTGTGSGSSTGRGSSTGSGEPKQGVNNHPLKVDTLSGIFNPM